MKKQTYRVMLPRQLCDMTWWLRASNNREEKCSAEYSIENLILVYYIVE
jgi:hypothetical protein